MGFWEKFTKALELMGLVLLAAASLEAVGGSLETPEVRLQIKERVYYIKAKVRRSE